MTAIRKNEEAEDKVFYKHIQYVQARILREISNLSREYCADIYFSCDMRSNACDMLKAFLLSPPKDIAKAFFSLKHNEEFGVGEYIDKSTKFRLDLMLMAFFGRKHRSAFAQFLRNTSWPQGYLSMYNLKLMLLIYNLRYSQ